MQVMVLGKVNKYDKGNVKSRITVSRFSFLSFSFNIPKVKEKSNVRFPISKGEVA